MAAMDDLSVSLAEGVAVEWDHEQLDPVDSGGFTDRPWRLRGEPGPQHSALRVLTAKVSPGEKGELLLLVAALRPAEAEGHDAEQPGGISRDGDGTRALAEVLLSTEYDGAGVPRRIGLELYPEDGSYAVRAAGDAVARRVEESDGWRREIAELDFRYDGSDGVATYEVWHRA